MTQPESDPFTPLQATLWKSPFMTDVQLKLKLLVDKENKRMVFAESQRDFVDALFSFLTLPVGTVVRKLNKQSLLGCMDKVYESVEKLDLQLMETKACKGMLLHPRSAAEEACEDLRLNINNTECRTAYSCPTWDCFTKASLVYSNCKGAKCPKCGLNMDRQFYIMNEGTKEDGVFVRGGGSFMIRDDLLVMPTSMDATLSLLRTFGVDDDSTSPEEMNVEIGEEKMVNILKRLLLSHTPLTDVLLGELDVKRDVDVFLQEVYVRRDTYELGKEQKPSIVNPEKASTGTKRLKMKLLLSRSMNFVLYAEAGGDIVDFIFSFLTIPLGLIIKLFDKCSSMGCLGNLYKSIDKLVDVGRSVHADECTTMLLSPKLAPMYACSSQLLSIQEKACNPCEFFGCKIYYDEDFETTGTQCTHGVAHVTLNAINPKLPSSGTESGGGFTKAGEVYMITDELEVTPFSSISSFRIVSRLGISSSDLVVREVTLGEPEALKLLKASIVSKRALSNVFCSRKRKTPPA